MFCSSGLSSPPNGRPYSMPTRRSAAASARIAAGAAALLDLGRRRATDEVRDRRAADEDGVDPGTLERHDVVAAGGPEVGDRELPSGHVRQQVEDPLELL